MIHTCGNWCQVNGKCSKRLPMNSQSETTFDKNGMPQYMRKDTGQTFVTCNNRTVDYIDDDAHNGTLLKIFYCHINVVVVASYSSAKYLLKYICKGHDRATVIIHDNAHNITLNIHLNEHADNNLINHDEPKQFVDSRYVSAAESLQRS